MTAASFPINPGASRSYEVRLRASELSMRFYRPVGPEVVARLSVQDFSSNAALGRRRRWSSDGDGEDATQYFGISCIEGVSMDRPVTDPLGRVGVGLSVTRDGFVTQLIVDPSTTDLLAIQRHDPHGALDESLTYSTPKIVPASSR